MMTITEHEKQQMAMRLATEKDGPLITLFLKAMLHELFELGYEVPPTDHNIAILWVSILLPALRSGQHGIAFAESDGKAVGFYACTKEPSPFEIDGKRAFAWGIWVHPEHRRKEGIGRALQEFVHSHLSELGFTLLKTFVTDQNKPALVSARAAGWTQTARVMNIALEGKG